MGLGDETYGADFTRNEPRQIMIIPDFEDGSRIARRRDRSSVEGFLDHICER